MGTEEVGTVPLFNLWTLWWNGDRLHNLYQGYWNAPIFHPLEGAFAFSEPQPLTGLLAAFFEGLTGSPVLAYNAIVVFGLTLNGWTACRLLSAVGLGWLPALAGGAMVEYLPFVQQELGVLQLVSLFGILATLHALVRLSQRPSAGRGALLGVAFSVTALMCGYYALSLSVLLLFGVGWLLAGRLTEQDTWYALGLALLVSLVLLLPIVPQQLRIMDSYGLERSSSTMQRFSATWEHYRYAPWPQLVPAPGVETASRPGARAFWPGTVKVCLALVGLVWGLSHGPRRWTAFCVTVLVVAFFLSLGPGSGGLSLHGVLSALYPGFSQLRSPFRFAVFVQLAVALLAAGALDAVWVSRRWPALGRGSLVLCLVILATFEIRSARQALLPIPSLEVRLPWIEWVESRTPPDAVLAFLPFPKGRSSRDYLETVLWMFWQMRHGRPMVNGYSGFFPRPFRELKAVLEDFPQGGSLEMLAQRGVRYCVILRDAFVPSDLAFVRNRRHRLHAVFADDVAGVDIYEISAGEDLVGPNGR